jgi:DNA polymerase-3 subunit gamma/tau
MALNCPRRDPSGDPCGECENCVRVWSGAANLDVIEIDAASNRGVDDARELRERAMYAASREGHYKVYIVDEAHMLTREAWNALLKVLEEPPPGVVFVFATTEPQKIAATAAPVLSRLQRFDFRRIGPAAIRDRLGQVLQAEGIRAEDDALTLIARHADGGMRDALSVLDQCLSLGEGEVTATRVREVLGLSGDELYAELLELVAERRPAGVFPLTERLIDSGADLVEFMGGAGETLRSLLLLQLGGEPEGLTEAMRQALHQYRDRLAPGDVLRMLRLLTDDEAAIRRGGSPRLVVETLLLRWTMLDRIVDLEQVLKGAPGGPPSLTPRRGEGAPPSVPTPASSASSATAPAQPPPARSGPLSMPLSASVSALQSAWPEIVAQLRERSQFLSQALAATSPSAVEAGWLTVTLVEANALFAEKLEAQAPVVEEVLRPWVEEPLRLRVSQPVSSDAISPRPNRFSQGSIQADRLRSLRAKDPALDTAADALDLEIVD